MQTETNEFAACAGVKSITLEAIVIRADGTREDLGVISQTFFDENGQPKEPGNEA